MRNETSYGNGFFQIIKGVGLALALALLWAVIFANVLRFSSLPDKVVYPINQTWKVLAVCIGALVFVRGEKGFLKGAAIGLLFSALSYLAFAALGGDFSLSWLIIVELALSALAGVICGAIAVNLKKSG
ncbi:MAG: TIGR04086 family membrane protein [Clostridia bacterium]|nr:TIGR04086 family membrane protein [Clostridia bacterium]